MTLGQALTKELKLLIGIPKGVKHLPVLQPLTAHHRHTMVCSTAAIAARAYTMQMLYPIEPCEHELSGIDVENLTSTFENSELKNAIHSCFH